MEKGRRNGKTKGVKVKEEGVMRWENMIWRSMKPVMGAQ